MCKVRRYVAAEPQSRWEQWSAVEPRLQPLLDLQRPHGNGGCTAEERERSGECWVGPVIVSYSSALWDLLYRYRTLIEVRMPVAPQVSNQVDHFSKWFDRERSQYEQVQRSRPSTSSSASAGRARTGAPGQTRAGCGVRVVERARHHAGSVQPHLQTGADLGWLAGAGTKTEVVARSQSTTPTPAAQARGYPRDSQSPNLAATSRPGTASSAFADHKDGKWIASMTPPPLTPNTRLTLGAHSS